MKKNLITLILLLPILVFAKGGGGGHGGGGHSSAHGVGGHNSMHGSFSEAHGGNISHEGYSSFKSLHAYGYENSISGKSYVSKENGTFVVPTHMNYSSNELAYSSPYKYRISNTMNYDLSVNNIQRVAHSNYINNYYYTKLFLGSSNLNTYNHQKYDEDNSLDLSVLNSNFAYVNDGDDGNDKFEAFKLPIMGYSNYSKESFEGLALDKSAIDLAGSESSLAIIYPTYLVYAQSNFSCKLDYINGSEINILNESQLLVLNKNSSITKITNPCEKDESRENIKIDNEDYSNLSALVNITNSRTYIDSYAVWISRNTNNMPIIFYRNESGLSYNFPTFNKECIFIGSDIDDNNTQLNPIKNCVRNNVSKIAYSNNKVYLNTDFGIFSFQINKKLINSNSVIKQYKDIYPNEYKEHQKKETAMHVLLGFMIFFILVFVIFKD